MSDLVPAQSGRRYDVAKYDLSRPGLNLLELHTLWSEARRPSPKTIWLSRQSVIHFIAVVGDLDVSELRSTDLVVYRDALLLIPRSLSWEERSLDFANLAARMDSARDDRPKLARASVMKQLRYIQTLVGFAFSERWIPHHNLRDIRVDGEPALRRRSFKPAELARLFALPLFVRPWTSPERRHQITNETIRWLMLLGLLTGARIEELSQLQTADIGTEDDIDYIDITDIVMVRAPPKSLKTPSSRRRIPFHPRLKDLGFRRLVELRREQGYTFLAQP